MDGLFHQTLGITSVGQNTGRNFQVDSTADRASQSAKPINAWSLRSYDRPFSAIPDRHLTAADRTQARPHGNNSLEKYQIQSHTKEQL